MRDKPKGQVKAPFFQPMLSYAPGRTPMTGFQLIMLNWGDRSQKFDRAMQTLLICNLQQC